jgi:hypothetical protein
MIKKITLLLILVTQFSFSQSMSQFQPSDLYAEHVDCTSSGSTYNSYDLENNVLTIQTDDATISTLRFTAQIRFKNAADKGLKISGADVTKSDIFTSNTSEFIIDGFTGGDIQDAATAACNDVSTGKLNYAFFTIDFSNNTTWNSKSGYTEIELANAVNIIPTTSAFNGNTDYLQNVQMTVKVIYDATLSTNNLKQINNFSFTPNPTKDFIQLSAANPIQGVQIYNLLGQEVLQNTYTLRNAKVDVSALNEGVYVLKVVINGNIGTYKFMKE